MGRLGEVEWYGSEVPYEFLEYGLDVLENKVFVDFARDDYDCERVDVEIGDDGRDYVSYTFHVCGKVDGMIMYVTIKVPYVLYMGWKRMLSFCELMFVDGRVVDTVSGQSYSVEGYEGQRFNVDELRMVMRRVLGDI